MPCDSKIAMFDLGVPLLVAQIRPSHGTLQQKLQPVQLGRVLSEMCGMCEMGQAIYALRQQSCCLKSSGSAPAECHFRRQTTTLCTEG